MQADFDEIYRLYAKRLYLFIYSKCKSRELAEDILQSTFLKAIINIDSFREESSMYTWLCSIAINTLNSEIRLSEYKNYSLEEIIEKNVDAFTKQNEEDVLAKLINKEEKTELYHNIDKLGEKKKQVVLMRLQGLPFKEISQLLGKSEGWAKMNYKRAVEDLRRNMSR
jgi:RNA polymerase sigma-70 factor (ECF subfamily)